MDTSGYKLSDVDNISQDIEFFWEKPQLEMDAFSEPKIDTTFSITVFNDLEMGEGGSSKNPIVLDEEEDKENSPPTNPVSEQPTESPKLRRSRSFRGRIENVPESVYRALFEKLEFVRVFYYY